MSAPNINGGAFTDITNAAVGGSFVSGGYDTSISPSFSSPIGGRLAWTGTSNGYITTVANLGPNVVGQTIKLRFRMASDSSNSGTGWRVDTVKVASGSVCCGGPPAISAVPPAVLTAESYTPPMPLYEYRCNGCGAKVSIFVKSVSSEVSGSCNQCGSTDLNRLISRVAVIHAPVQNKDLSKQELLHGVDYGDPSSMANMFRQMGQMFHDEKDENMDEIIGRLDHGESVEHALGLDDHTGHDHGAPPLDAGGGEE